MINFCDRLTFFATMDENTRKNMKHLIKMFEARVDKEGEDAADVREISQMTEEAFNTALGIVLHSVLIYCNRNVSCNSINS